MLLDVPKAAWTGVGSCDAGERRSFERDGGAIEGDSRTWELKGWTIVPAVQERTFGFVASPIAAVGESVALWKGLRPNHNRTASWEEKHATV